MKPLRSAQDVLEIAARCAPTTAVARRIRESGATVLGRFNPVQNLPGWIVKTQDNRLIGIELDEVNRRYRVCYPKEVPWSNFEGNPYAPHTQDVEAARSSPLHQGQIRSEGVPPDRNIVGEERGKERDASES